MNNYRYKNQKHGLDVPCIGIGSWGYTAGKEQLGDRANQLAINESSKSTRTMLKSQQSGNVAAVRMVS